MNFFRNLFTPKFPSIDVNAYKDDYFKKKNHVLVDVRTAQEFKSGHIPGAKNVPLNQLSKQLKKVPKNRTVVVVCQSGNRSRSACNLLINAGYEDVINLNGGTTRWRMAGNKTE
jgi:rhodanese-related sulfurtransferase